MTPPDQTGRLSLFRAALVIARRDFVAILFSRSFFFFLLGPLFPLLIGVIAGSVGSRVEENINHVKLGVALPADQAYALIAAGHRLAPQLGEAAPEMVIIADQPAKPPAGLLREQHGAIAAVVSGSLADPVLTGPAERIGAWRGSVALIAAQALHPAAQAIPVVALTPVQPGGMTDRQGQMRTAQAGQMLLFLLTMLLAGMVLSNLVEEKANKIIEVLAAAIPMDAVFHGKLLAMLGVSFVGIAAWGAVFGTIALTGGHSLAEFTVPAVGWPLFIALGTAYFAMAYLLLGSVFLGIGAMATTVREVQTLSMPVSMSQIMIFFFATFASASPGTPLELAAEAFPLSSPFTMLGRAARDAALAPHLLALSWQALWVILFVRFGALLFRRRVLKSGPQRTKVSKRRTSQA